MYLCKSLLYAVSLLSTASTVLSAPVDVVCRGAEPLVDVSEDLSLRAVVPTYTDLYTRMAYGSLVDTADALTTRAENTDLPHPESEYRKVRVSTHLCIFPDSIPNSSLRSPFTLTEISQGLWPSQKVVGRRRMRTPFPRRKSAGPTRHPSAKRHAPRHLRRQPPHWK